VISLDQFLRSKEIFETPAATVDPQSSYVHRLAMLLRSFENAHPRFRVFPKTGRLTRVEVKPERRKIMAVISLAQMMEAGVHFGHQARRWNPKMSPYIYTARNGVHIIDLVQTAQLIERAYVDLRRRAEKGQKFLFVGTKRQATNIIAQEALRCGASYVNQRWLGGMLTNWTTIKTRVDHLKELENQEESGLFKLLPKKEAAVRRQKLERLQKYLNGIKHMRKLPDLVLIVDQRREHNAVLECRKLGIPIVSLLDTNCDPDLVNIPIPANDDAIRSIKLIISTLANAIYEGHYGQPDTDSGDDYEDYEGEYEDYEDGEAVDTPDTSDSETEAMTTGSDDPDAVAAVEG